MKEGTQNFIISPIGIRHERISRYSSASPWPDAEVCFNAQNVAYPTLHSHEYYEVLVILSGAISHEINGSTHILRRGDCVLIRPNDCHRLKALPKTDTNSAYLNVNFMIKPSFFDKLMSLYDEPPFPTTNDSPAPITFTISSSMIDRIRKICLYIQFPFNEASASNIQTTKALVSELVNRCVVSRMIEFHSRTPVWLNDFIVALQSPDNFHKTIHELIESIPYSYSYIQKQFKLHTGTSIVAYINAIKMAHAKELLLGTKQTATEIAMALGFESIAHMNHLFKKTYGISPIAFRKENQ